MATQPKEPCWVSPDIGKTNVANFLRYVNKKHNLDLKSYEELHQWSVDPLTLQDFWRDAYIYLELAPEGSDTVGPMMESKNHTGLFPPPTFFPHDRLNVAELLLRKGADDKVAIHFARENVSGIEQVTWDDLRDRVQRTRDAMLNSGVRSGDVVAAVITNSVDAMVICLAALSIGAVWSSSSPDLGPDAIHGRYGQVDPKLVFADDSYVYAGKLVKLGHRIEQWAERLGKSGTQLRNVVVIANRGVETDCSKIYRGCTYEAFLGRGSGQPLEFQLLPFSHPAFILYSSGTTGKPKCIVHTAGGVALKARTDSIIQHDIRSDDVIFQYTTTSWVMWLLNFMNLASGASMLLYDGSPYNPRPTILLELAERTGVTVFGTSPRYLSDLRARSIEPRKQFNLDRLRVVTSTGSVLSEDLYRWFYAQGFPPKAHLISMSGGTDIAGSFVGGTPLLPVFAGEIQCKALGMAVDIYDPERAEGVSVEKSGAAGELVCTQPFPSQPHEFHGPGGLEKYRSSYFERFGPKGWCQGDFIQRLTDTGGLLMLGRSDGVLNPSGVRFGSAEIYAVTETFSDISDAICVGQRRECDNDEQVLLFVKMKPDCSFTQDLQQRLRAAIRDKYTPRHVPKYIFAVADIPYTINGKKCEINVKHIVSGRAVAVSNTVANPKALELYKRFQDLPTESKRIGTKANL
ncbi:acetoacetate-CoA ligase [Fusarium oxysporum f. sp. vasinfectum 25433]|uniref:Acetoacetate-CoA ligase n=1 Tax=Fusarium oxysporum f. sp. vasinfectum 25433 TaxID=1089449 RepID=X0KXD1_FUSOX|nr:acetoacetate-CoA ligase [Fusarium oxysporum f. sp. vasinfectum 25433]